MSIFTTVTFEAQEFIIPSERRQTLEGCAITDAGGHGDHGDADQASHHAGQSAFHSGAHDHDARAGERRAIGQQAVNSGHADIVEMLDFIAHHFRGDDGLFGHGNVAGAGRDHGNDPLAIFFLVAAAEQWRAPASDTRL